MHLRLSLLPPLHLSLRARQRSASHRSPALEGGPAAAGQLDGGGGRESGEAAGGPGDGANGNNDGGGTRRQKITAGLGVDNERAEPSSTRLFKLGPAREPARAAREQ
nr:unnamed protein product [Digitaria exilis]